MDERAVRFPPFVSAAAKGWGFVAAGVITAFVGELQFSVFIRGDWANLFGSMVFNALYLTAAYVVCRLIFRLVRSPAAAYLVCAALAAVVGLGIEWFVIGNSPWGNPAASEVGMAAYWACMVVVGLILVDPDPRLRPARRFIIVYALAYTAVILAGQALIPSAEWRFVFHIWTVVYGYLGLIVACVIKVLRATGTTPVVRLTG
jgi:hypothetical protein